MVFQGAQNGPPGCQNGGTKPHKWEPRGAKRGRRQRAEPLRFAAPPQGEPGVNGFSLCSAESKDSGRPPHNRRPLPKVLLKSSISRINSSMSFLHSKFAKSTKMNSKRTPLGAPNPLKSKKKPARKQHKKHMQKVSKNNAKLEAQHLPKQAFHLKGLHFLRFAASAEKRAK